MKAIPKLPPQFRKRFVRLEALLFWSGLSCEYASTLTGTSLDLHSRLDGHTRPQQMVRILTLVEPNSHGESLHHFHVVPGRIFRRKEAEERASGARKAVHFGLVVAPEGINADCDRLTRSHSS